MKTGDRLIEQKLADALGLSRAPIRLGLKALEEAGFARGELHRGFVLTRDPTSVAAQSTLAAVSRAEEAYATIATDVVAKRLPADVTEAELLRRYDLTRTELQRLLDRIAAEGWIARSPGYGWRFAETVSSPEAQTQVMAFRAVIEPAAIAQPGYALAPEVIERLRERQLRIFDGELEKFTIGEVFQWGCDFHEEIARGAKNPFFVESLKRVNSIRRLFAYRSFADRDGMRRHVKEHLRLLDVLEARRYADASALMMRHIRRPLKVYVFR
ncbi:MULTISPECIES: GntR family transcriptional regulator [Bradyrhizobium]|nr:MULTISPECIES: GntR family transcriptional regulator [Bradyrhizobium]MCG2628280.1 GntR family transcriptional regulator [Bradyrhizobium zhengyangense]MCG2670286.1 GntR family transcriptional regulator [Bradyrhizobium zhengyangense]MDN4985979.1 GntR family transcriptional regulator [Bradyrhizobium sp. WYCCWR 13022]MDN5002641.1 GntR family transcriptional regulator [Bradyrhizobium sp. WYCCWR 12677]MDT4736822.1 GntR family transcriptional regulator [Bradyrhizobium sp. WYCCWR 12699]